MLPKKFRGGPGPRTGGGELSPEGGMTFIVLFPPIPPLRGNPGAPPKSIHKNIKFKKWNIGCLKRNAVKVG